MFYFEYFSNKSQQQEFSLGKTVYSPFAVKTTSELVIRFLERTDIGKTVIQAGEFVFKSSELISMLDILFDYV